MILLQTRFHGLFPIASCESRTALLPGSMPSPSSAMNIRSDLHFQEYGSTAFSRP